MGLATDWDYSRKPNVEFHIMPFFKRKPGIAVIEMHGVIGTAIKEPEYSKLLENVRNNRKIGALVLDIDSPGGSATASDLIYENVREVARRKPVVAYVRGLGASGGYYIACGAGTIMASRAALVGIHRRHLPASYPAAVVRQAGASSSPCSRPGGSRICRDSGACPPTRNRTNSSA